MAFGHFHRGRCWVRVRCVAADQRGRSSVSKPASTVVVKFNLTGVSAGINALNRRLSYARSATALPARSMKLTCPARPPPAILQIRRRNRPVFIQLENERSRRQRGTEIEFQTVTVDPSSKREHGNYSLERESESVASSVVSASQMPYFTNESITTPRLPDPALSQHLC